MQRDPINLLLGGLFLVLVGLGLAWMTRRMLRNGWVVAGKGLYTRSQDPVVFWLFVGGGMAFAAFLVGLPLVALVALLAGAI